MRIAILTTHLLGTGHLSRAIALADGFAAAGWEALVISGGRPAPHLAPTAARLLQLPPVASDGVNFRRLLDESGAPVSEALMAARLTALSEALEHFAPGVLITELFPFGRRVLAAEFEAALSSPAARRARVYASVRDVLAPPSSPAKAAATEARVGKFYDGVLVHADPAIIRLEQSWPVSPDLAERLRYTGFVAPPLPPPARPGADGEGEIMVSAGGGSVGAALFEAAALAAAHSTDGARWRLLVGGADRAARITALASLAAGAAPDWRARLTLEPVRPDFRALLPRAAVSVNQAGYNTLLDVALTGVPSVTVPFEEGGETEQAQRASAFATKGLMILREAELTPESLTAAVSAARDAGPPDIGPIAVDGVPETVRIVSSEASL
ncbi:MAG: glycosyltransferase [Rhodobacteraceae bacterium]|nr:glycosyltransferase [Paracoccaceae bacterium]